MHVPCVLDLCIMGEVILKRERIGTVAVTPIILHQSATLAAGPGPEASEKLTRISEIYIKLLRATVPRASEK